MYYVINLLTNTIVATARNELELLCVRESTRPWSTRIFLRFDYMRCGWYMDFSELNVTGKDIHPNAVFRYFGGVDGDHPLQVSGTKPMLRRYQVIDDYKRPIDIRTWRAEIQLLEANGPIAFKMAEQKLPKFRHEPCGYGRKRHCHRVSCPAMTRQGVTEELVAGFDDSDFDYLPVIDHSKARNRGIAGQGFDLYDLKAGKAARNAGRSWKHQSKSVRQWAKHKRGVKLDGLRKPDNYHELDLEGLCSLSVKEVA